VKRSRRLTKVTTMMLNKGRMKMLKMTLQLALVIAVQLSFLAQFESKVLRSKSSKTQFLAWRK